MDFKDITKIGIGGLQGIRMNDLYGNGISSLPYTSSTEPSEFDIAISDFLCLRLLTNSWILLATK